MEIKGVTLDVPWQCRLMMGQGHFIKRVEDIYERLSTSLPGEL
jgi:adenosine/AMP kinase